LVNSSKLTYGSGGDKAELELMLRIVEILFGDRRELGRKNVFP